MEENEEVQQEQQPEQQKVVPHAALHEQRILNKQLRDQLAESNQRTAKMEETFQRVLAGLNQQPAPNFEQDPLGHFQARNAELEKHLKGLDEKLEKIGKSNETSTAIQRLNTQAESYEAEFRSQHPDYDQAVKFLKDISRQDLEDQGHEKAQIEQMLTHGKLALAEAAISQGKDPAQVIYERAKRYGFKGQARKENPLAVLEKGQSMAKQSGNGGVSGVTLADLSNLDDGAIDALVQDPEKWNKLIRGQMVQ